MHVTPEQITAANKTNVEAALSIAAAQFAAMEKLAGLQTSALKSFFEDAMTNTRAPSSRSAARPRCSTSVSSAWANTRSGWPAPITSCSVCTAASCRFDDEYCNRLQESAVPVPATRRSIECLSLTERRC